MILVYNHRLQTIVDRVEVSGVVINRLSQTLLTQWDLLSYS
jgi:hypothetical protein